MRLTRTPSAMRPDGFGCPGKAPGILLLPQLLYRQAQKLLSLGNRFREFPAAGQRRRLQARRPWVQLGSPAWPWALTPRPRARGCECRQQEGHSGEANVSVCGPFVLVRFWPLGCRIMENTFKG